MKLAIDIGSNTIKCLLGEAVDGKVNVLYERTLDSRICASNGGLVSDASTRISEAIKIFIADSKKVSKSFDVIAVATSALRDSTEREKILAEVFNSTSVKIKILDGKEEARFSYLGATSGVDVVGTSAFFDLGGGSLEVAFGENGIVKKSCSMPIGAVRMTGEFFAKNIDETSIANLSEKVSRALSGAISTFPRFDNLIGVGGAVVAARLLKKRLGLLGAEYEISLEDMQTMFAEVSKLSSFERVEKFGISASRADIVPAAFLTIICLMCFLKSPKLIHTFCNIRYGIILGGI